MTTVAHIIRSLHYCALLLFVLSSGTDSIVQPKDIRYLDEPGLGRTLLYAEGSQIHHWRSGFTDWKTSLRELSTFEAERKATEEEIAEISGGAVKLALTGPDSIPGSNAPSPAPSRPGLSLDMPDPKPASPSRRETLPQPRPCLSTPAGATAAPPAQPKNNGNSAFGPVTPSRPGHVQPTTALGSSILLPRGPGSASLGSLPASPRTLHPRSKSADDAPLSNRAAHLEFSGAGAGAKLKPTARAKSTVITDKMFRRVSGSPEVGGGIFVDLPSMNLAPPSAEVTTEDFEVQTAMREGVHVTPSRGARRMPSTDMVELATPLSGRRDRGFSVEFPDFKDSGWVEITRERRNVALALADYRESPNHEDNPIRLRYVIKSYCKLFYQAKVLEIRGGKFHKFYDPFTPNAIAALKDSSEIVKEQEDKVKAGLKNELATWNVVRWSFENIMHTEFPADERMVRLGHRMYKNACRVARLSVGLNPDSHNAADEPRYKDHIKQLGVPVDYNSDASWEQLGTTLRGSLDEAARNSRELASPELDAGKIVEFSDQLKAEIDTDLGTLRSITRSLMYTTQLEALRSENASLIGENASLIESQARSQVAEASARGATSGALRTVTPTADAMPTCFSCGAASPFPQSPAPADVLDPPPADVPVTGQGLPTDDNLRSQPWLGAVASRLRAVASKPFCTQAWGAVASPPPEPTEARPILSNIDILHVDGGLAEVRFPYIDFEESCGDEMRKADFLRKCSAAVAPARCTDARRGSTIVTIEGSSTEIEAAVAKARAGELVIGEYNTSLDVGTRRPDGHTATLQSPPPTDADADADTTDADADADADADSDKHTPHTCTPAPQTPTPTPQSPPPTDADADADTTDADAPDADADTTDADADADSDKHTPHTPAPQTPTPTPQTPTPPDKTPWVIAFVALGVVLIGVGVLLWWWLRRRSQHKAENPDIQGNETRVIDHLDWRFLRKVGEGSYGSVFAAINTRTGKLFAVKAIWKGGAKAGESIKQVMQEIHVLSQLNHPNIVRYLGSRSGRTYFHMYLEYVPGGSLEDLMASVAVNMGSRALGISLAQNYTTQILNGLAFLHANKVVHRDIKPANVLMTAEGTVKLADFGASFNMNAVTHTDKQTICGTPAFMAPEVVAKDHHTTASDIWSTGVLTFEMVTGQLPFPHPSAHRLLLDLAKTYETQKIKVSWPERIHPRVRHFVKTCLNPVPAQRSSASLLLAHPFFDVPKPLISHGAQVNKYLQKVHDRSSPAWLRSRSGEDEPPHPSI